MPEPSSQDLATWSSEARLRYNEDVEYLARLRSKNKPKEMLALMDVRLEINREIRDFLTRLSEANPIVQASDTTPDESAPAAPPEKEENLWDD